MIDKKSLLDALSWCGVHELPEEYNGKEVYIKAISLVSKRDGSKSYVAVVKDYETGNDRIVKDFGSTSMIAKIDKTYPYLYLNSSFLPTFQAKDKDNRIKWLKRKSYGFKTKKDYDSMSMKELNMEIVLMAIKDQLESEMK